MYRHSLPQLSTLLTPWAALLDADSILLVAGTAVLVVLLFAVPLLAPTASLFAITVLAAGSVASELSRMDTSVLAVLALQLGALDLTAVDLAAVNMALLFAFHIANRKLLAVPTVVPALPMADPALAMALPHTPLLKSVPHDAQHTVVPALLTVNLALQVSVAKPLSMVAQFPTKSISLVTSMDC